jgi:hypothetical protein
LIVIVAKQEPAISTEDDEELEEAIRLSQQVVMLSFYL